MCGIAGFTAYDRDARSPRERAALTAMTATMGLRGPDAEGLWTDRHVALGHRRLAVIDVEGGVQPMVAHTPDLPVALTYSGEVYNYRELRRVLEKLGHTFRTVSDTEVVLRSYLQWGRAAFTRLNGIYAFAVWDGRTEELLLVRDRLGVKPLCYAPWVGGVLFGSEPKAVLTHPAADRGVDLAGLRDLFMYTRPPEAAVWRGMRNVPPGAVVTVTASGTRTHTYWALPEAALDTDAQAAARDVRELLHDTVRRQLVADVPHCVLLSGGLDSSVVTALAARSAPPSGPAVRSFAVDFEGHADTFVPDELRGTRDAPFVAEMARHAGTEHRDIVLDSHVLADRELRRAVVAARDLPMGLGDLDASMYLLFRAIRQEATVALSGEAADEVFGGYSWSHSPTIRDADTFPWYAAMQPDPELAVVMLRPELRRALRLTDHVRQCYREAVAHAPAVPAGATREEARMALHTHLHLTQWLPYVLERKDRLSMANGLEVRVPFCDHRLVERVFATAWSVRADGGREKSLLRAAVGDLLPSSVRERRKSQYPTTLDPTYLATLQLHGKELLADADHAVFALADRAWATATMDTDPSSWTPPQRNGVQRLLDLAVWLEEYAPVLVL